MARTAETDGRDPIRRASGRGRPNETSRCRRWCARVWGAAGTVGYDDFTEPAAELEQFAKAQVESRIQSKLSEIKDLANRLVVPDETDEPKVLRA